MYRFHSLNQKQSGKESSLSGLMGVFVDNRQTSNMFPTASLLGAAISAKKKSINCQFLLAFFHIILTAWLITRQLHAEVKVSDGVRLLLLTPSHILTPGFALCQNCEADMFAFELMMEKLWLFPSTANWKILLASLEAHVPPSCALWGQKNLPDTYKCFLSPLCCRQCEAGGRQSRLHQNVLS